MKPTRSSHEWGQDHYSCRPALRWRLSLGPESTQEEAWLECTRIEWLLWQLKNGLSKEEYSDIQHILKYWFEKESVRLTKEYVLSCGDKKLEQWAEKWLFGTDRTLESARAARERAWSLQPNASANVIVTAIEVSAESNKNRVMAIGTSTTKELSQELADSLRKEIPNWRWEK